MTMVVVMVWFISLVPTRPLAKRKEGLGGRCLDSVELRRVGRRVFTLGLSGMWREGHWRSGGLEWGGVPRADEKFKGLRDVWL